MLHHRGLLEVEKGEVQRQEEEVAQVQRIVEESRTRWEAKREVLPSQAKKELDEALVKCVSDKDAQMKTALEESIAKYKESAANQAASAKSNTKALIDMLRAIRDDMNRNVPNFAWDKVTTLCYSSNMKRWKNARVKWWNKIRVQRKRTEARNPLILCFPFPQPCNDPLIMSEYTLNFQVF